KEEKILTHIMQTTLRIEKIGVFDNYFNLGWDSIISIQVISRARKAGLNIVIHDLLENCNIHDLARKIRNKKSFRSKIVEQYKGSVLLLPIQHWFFNQKFKTPQYFTQDFMFSLKPELDFSAFLKTLKIVISHHDAFHLRYKYEKNNTVLQFYSDNPPSLISILDLENSNDFFGDLEKYTTKIKNNLSIHGGPLYNVSLIKGHPDKLPLLWVLVHHLLIDMVSWRILCEDIETVYYQIIAGKPPSLPVSSTYKEWADTITNYANSLDMKKEIFYWKSITPARPLTKENSQNLFLKREESTLYQFELSENETDSFLEAIPYKSSSQINELLLTALALTLEDWTGRSENRIHLESHGRSEYLNNDVDVSRTMGWFTALFPFSLKIPIPSNKRTIDDCLKSIKTQLHTIPNRGVGYGVLKYLYHDEELIKFLEEDDRFTEICFNYLGQIYGEIDGSLMQIIELPVREAPQKNIEASYPINIDCLIIKNKFRVITVYDKNFYTLEEIVVFIKHFIHQIKNIANYIHHKHGVQKMKNISSFANESGIEIHDVSLLKLIATNKIPKIDSAALYALPIDLANKFSMTEEDFCNESINNEPVCELILDTPYGRIGVIHIPIFYERLFEQENKLHSVLDDALIYSKTLGARCISLTGLIPSATNYALNIKSDPAYPMITTGHGATTAALVMNIEHILNITGRKMEEEILSIIGLGSIGVSTLKLILDALPSPRKIILCDILKKKDELEKIKLQVANSGYLGEILITQSHSAVADEVYEATFIIGATYISNLLNTNLIKPNTIIVDDSSPNIFNLSEVLERACKKQDVYAVQGGAISLGQDIKYTVQHLPLLQDGLSKIDLQKHIASFPANIIAACSFSSIIPLISKLPPSQGIVDLPDIKNYYKFFKENSIDGSFLGYSHLYPSDLLRRFKILKSGKK
ncbi:TPA: hypothetical protein JA993_16090, partial [Legionella pneumophila]|nr:hypothetical protein [Legionella pneumophila]